MPDFLITTDDVRAAGFCVTGLKGFSEQDGIDLRRLVRAGIPYSEVQHIEDANFKLGVEQARIRHG